MAPEQSSRERIIIVSDWHLPAERTAQTDFFARFTREVCAGAARVFVLGDLFGAWVGPKHATRPGHVAAFEALAELAASGTKVVIARGNRDFLLDRKTLARHGLELAPDVWRGDLPPGAARLSHGDELTENDRLHKTLRAVIGNFPISTFVKMMPLGVSDALADAYRWLSARRRSRRKRKMLRPSARAVRAEFESGSALVVIGHWHQPAIETDAYGMPGKTFVMLGECTDASAGYAEISGGAVRLREFPPPSPG